MTTRELILAHLSGKEEGDSVSGIIRSVGKNPNTIRHAIASLQREGRLVEEREDLEHTEGGYARRLKLA